MSKSKLDDKQDSPGELTGVAVLSAEERRAQGGALRDAVLREAHGGWKPSKKWCDPIDLLIASNEGRMPELIPIHFGRMLQSPFTFYRGSAAIRPPTWRPLCSPACVAGLRRRASVELRRLCHPKRQVVFDVSNLDETLPAPWEWDLKRLVASIVIAAQYLRLHESEAARAAAVAVRAYRERMADASAWPTIRRCARSMSGMTRMTRFRCREQWPR